jgi:predicted transcriptional regulator
MTPPKKTDDPDRVVVRADLRKKYTQGATVRDLAEQVGRSYGYVHRILTENKDFQLRDRGGKRKKKASA